MNLTEMRTLVRRDLKDEDSSNYRWTDDEIDRAIARAVKEFSQSAPREMKATLATVIDSFYIDISSLSDRVSVDKVEFPIDNRPRTYVRFSIYQDTLCLRDFPGDGESCYVYYSALHTLDGATSTVPARYEDLVALGATACAALSQSQYSTNRANYGGEDVDRDYLSWARARLKEFQEGCRKAGGKLNIHKLIAEEY